MRVTGKERWGLEFNGAGQSVSSALAAGEDKRSSAAYAAFVVVFPIELYLFPSNLLVAYDAPLVSNCLCESVSYMLLLLTKLRREYHSRVTS